jgi:hypothetical protein
MKLVDQKVEHRYIHDPQWDCIELYWKIGFEESDFNDPKMFEKFYWIEVTQHHRLGTIYIHSKNKKQVLTWFKGNRTNTFNYETTDKKKKMVIKKVEDFILANSKVLAYNYIKDEDNI